MTTSIATEIRDSKLNEMNELEAKVKALLANIKKEKALAKDECRAAKAGQYSAVNNTLDESKANITEMEQQIADLAKWARIHF